MTYLRSLALGAPVALLAAVVAPVAQAQSFPPASEFVDGVCDGAPASDPAGDTAGALGALDVVGTPATPCFGYAADATHLYLRLRVGDDPRESAAPLRWLPRGWGFEIDADGNLRDYEVLVMLDGTAAARAGEVRIARNTMRVPLDDPANPAEMVRATFPASTHARVQQVGSAWYAVVAVPFSELSAAGVPTGDLVIWAGSSSDGQVIDLDLACHNRNLSAPSLPYIPIYPVILGAYVSIDQPMAGSTIADRTPTVSGVADPGSTVEIRVDGALVATVTAAADGSWSHTLTAPLADGSHTIEVNATDPDSNTANASVSFTVNGPGAVDSDGDGVSDEIERPGGVDRDTDMDGTPDHQDADDDGDGVPTRVEIASGVDTDTDMDGTPDYRDADDDGDGVPTRDERPMDMDVDTDTDGDPDYLDADDDGDGIPTATERADAMSYGEDDDGVPAYLDTDADGDGDLDADEGQGDADGDGVPNYLDPDDATPRVDAGPAADAGGAGGDAGPPVDSGPAVPGYSGGAVCSASPGSSGAPLAWILFALALGGLVLRRRRGAAAALLLGAGALVAPSAADAQAVHLDQYRSAETPDDGFAMSRPDDLGHLQLGAQLHLDYALNPLVYETNQGDSGTETASAVEHQLAAQLGLSFGLFDRLVIYAGLPVSLVMEGEQPAGGFGPDGAGVGDPWLGARVRLFGEREDVFALAAQATATFPLAQAANESMRWTGEDGVAIHPELLAELRPIDWLRVQANLGARFRATDRARFSAQQLDVSHELTWGLGVSVPILREADYDSLTAHAEVYGASTFERFGERAESPIEGILGVRVRPIEQLRLGLALGTGFTRGYGSPDLRGVLTVGWVQPLAESASRPGPDDRDGDGVRDGADECPSEPEDRDGFADDDGCPDVDNDEDGVLDGDDGAPNDPEDADGFEDEDGVPDPDNDRDGVPDTSDRCPTEAEDRDEIADDDGCPEEDADSDSVLDPDDHCPMTPGVANPDNPECSGCPARACVSAEGEIRILDRVEFATDSDEILERSNPVLEDVLSILSSNRQIRRVRIEGHTDDRGDDDHNMDLSRRRAAAVRAWLTSRGLAVGRLAAFGCGELHPRVANDTASRRQENRRVEFFILDPAPARSDHSVEGCVEAE